MDCRSRMDDWYNDSDDCPIPAHLFWLGGIYNFVFLVIAQLLHVVILVLLYLKGRPTSPLFRANASWAIAYCFTGPALSARAFFPQEGYVLSDHPVIVLAWSFGLCFHWLGTFTYMLEVLMVTTVQYTFVLQPLRVAYWCALAKKLRTAFTVYFGLTCIITGYGLLISPKPAFRVGLIMFYFFAQALGCAAFGCFVLLRAFRDVGRVARELPDIMPERLCKRLRLIKFVIGVLIFEALFISTLYVSLGAVPALQKIGGYIFFYIVAPQGVICLAFVPAVHSMMICRECSVPETPTRKADASNDNLDEILSEIGSASVCTMMITCQTSLEPVWQRGLSLKFLETYATERSVPEHYTTKDLCEQYVKPETENARSSMWEKVYSTHGVGSSTLLGKPTCMVCHAWSYNFEMLVSIISNYHGEIAMLDPDPQYFFIDVFSMNQHDLAEVMGRPIEGDDKQHEIERILQDNLTRAVSCSGRVLLALDPWEKPVTLTRSWCLYEIYTAHCTGTPLDVFFSESALCEFKNELEDNTVQLEALFCAVDVRNATATVQADQDMILGLMEEVGIDKFNDFIRSKLKSSLALAAIASIHVSF
eukprot:TRINITY_DN10004_c0_g1_i1.p1 TRINITY_DN10004_c0_g1~~TRINITY_DN10004_c0_g1_i1.p1  ORF type:complete len:591 (-),score=106.86 TRINITY_DN10004_c0_g1_i1:494-2266(-)